MKRVVAYGLLFAVGVWAAPANAVTFVTSVTGAPDPGATGGLVIDFEEGSILPDGIVFTPGSQYAILQGLVPHTGYNPAGDASHYLAVPGSGTFGTASIDFSQYQGTHLGDFSFYWGSIDRDNHLIVTTSTGSLDLFGSQLISGGFGSATSKRGNRRVYFEVDPTEQIESITLTSPTAFEVDDLVFDRAPGVPEPGTWLMFAGGFGMAGGLLRRSRTVSAA